jgi:hypothetical protein
MEDIPAPAVIDVSLSPPKRRAWIQKRRGKVDSRFRGCDNHSKLRTNLDYPDSHLVADQSFSPLNWDFSQPHRCVNYRFDSIRPGI